MIGWFSQKNEKYQRLRNEVKRLHKLKKVEIIPVILSSNGLVLAASMRLFEKYIQLELGE